MHCEGAEGVFEPVFCIKALLKLHTSCKMENKMQDDREMYSTMEMKKAAGRPLISYSSDCRLHTGTTEQACSFHTQAFAPHKRACRGR